MNRAEFLRFARVGAEERLANLQRELEAIYQRFPELRSARSAQLQNPYTAGVRSAVSGVRAAVEGAVTRRRTLSPEARRRIAEAQRKRWATYRRNTEQEATSTQRVQRKPRRTKPASRTKK